MPRTASPNEDSFISDGATVYLPASPLAGTENRIISNGAGVAVNATGLDTITWGPSSALTTVTVPAGVALGFLYYGGVWSVASQSYATAFGATASNSAFGNTQSGGSANTVSRSDHVHGREGDTGWINISFESGGGWTNYGSGWQNGQYRTINNEVICRGLISGGTLGNPGTGITYLPGPSANHLWNQRAYGVVNYDMSVRVDIVTTGHLYVNETVGQTANWLSLEGIRYYLS